MLSIALILFGVLFLIIGIFFKTPWLAGLGMMPMENEQQYDQFKRRYNGTGNTLLSIGSILTLIGLAGYFFL